MPIDNLSKITSRSGINTTILLEAGNANVTGIITAAGFDGPFTGGGGNNAGIVTAVGGLHVGTAGTVLHAINDSDVVKVGIGTTIPTAKLEISHPTHTSLVRLKRTTGNAGDFVMQIGGSNPGVIFDAVGISSDFIFQTQGNEIMRIDSLNKEVGIGTDNPFSLLDVFRKTTGTNKDIFSVRSHSGAFLVQCSDVAASNPSWALRTFSGEDLVLSPGGNADVHEKVRIKASDGSVGIGSTDPRSGFKLDVNGDLSLGESGGTDNTYIEQKQNGDLHIINSGRAGNGAAVSPTGGAGGIGINRYNTLAGGTTYFRDFTVYNGKSTKVLMVDGSESRVGIGTDAPDYGLHVYGAGDILVEDSANGSAHLRLRSSNNGSDVSNWKIKTGSNNYLFIDNDTVGGKSQLTIDDENRVGINSTSPTGDLDVVGSGTSTISTILINSITHNTNKASEAVLKFGYAHSGAPHARGHIKMVEQSDNSFDADLIFGLPTNDNVAGSTTIDDLVRITPLMGTQLTRGSQGGRAHTGNTSNFMKIGTWHNIQQQGRLKITVFGVATYDSNANVAGETIIYISSNANYTLKGHFYSVIHGISKRNGIQKVALKYDSTAPGSCEVWVKYNGSYSPTYHLADASIGYWVGADVNTNSTDVPAGAEEIFSSYSIATSDGSQSDVRVAISSEGHIGIGTHDPQAPVHIDGGTTGTQRLRVQNHASVGAFDGNYGSEFRHATSSANHCMLIHCQEANDDRRTLDISDANGVFAQFTNGKFGVGTAGNDAGHPTRDVEICSPDGGILRISSSDDSLGANEKLGTVEFHTDDDDGGHIGAAITAIADPSDAFGRRTALLFGTQSDEATDAVERLRITASGIVANAGFSTSFGRIQRTYGPSTVSGSSGGGTTTRNVTSGAVGKKTGGGTLVINAFRTSDPTKCTTVYYDFQLRGSGTNGNRSNERTVAHNGGVNYSITDISEGFRFTNNESFTVTMTATYDLTGEL